MTPKKGYNINANQPREEKWNNAEIQLKSLTTTMAVKN